MSDGTPIEWTDATWPIVAGCEKVSPGCRDCWALRTSWRLQHHPNPKVARVFKGTTKKVGSQLAWTGLMRPIPERLDWPLRWKQPRRIFVCSQSDLFHPAVPFDFIDQVFAVMGMCRRHTFQVLTKHPHRMAEYVHTAGRMHNIGYAQFAIANRNPRLPVDGYTGPVHTRLPFDNVLAGFSAEDQSRFDERWPHMEDLARSGWLVWASLEPLLGPIDLSRAFTLVTREKYVRHTLLQWVVVGGESGPKARPMHPLWVRSLRDQCAVAGVAGGVPFLFKQWGEWKGTMPSEPKPPLTVKCHEWDGGMTAWRVGKKKAGRTLAGREHNDFPDDCPF